MKTTNQKGMFWVIGTLCLAMAPQLVTMAPHLVLLAVLPTAWRLVAELRNWRPLPVLVRVGLTVFTVFILVVTYGGLFGRRVAVSLLTLMLALKLLETFRIRDARVVASLSLFLCATQFLFTQGIFMLVYGAATLVSATIALVYLHRREAFQPVGQAPPSGHSLFSDLGYSARLLALAIPTALVMFILFPRWNSPLWGMPESALDARSGLSDSMTPGSIQNLFMDDSPAFRAIFEGVLPPRSQMYWRGPVFWNFDGAEWTRSYYSRGNRATEMPGVAGSPWVYRLQIEPSEQRWIFSLDYPATVPRGTYLTMDYQLLSRRPITQLRSIELISNPEFDDTPEMSTTLRRAALEVPSGFDPRTREMMRAWAEETPDPRRLVNRVLTYFNQEEFHYTLNPALLTRNTVDEFLFSTREGFCEHYASAFTVMMRLAGVPARVVTGYQGGWYNEFGRYVLVRQSDAHAWSEVWLEGSGWTRVDPTAAVAPNRVNSGALTALEGRRHLLDFTWVRSLRNGFDFIQRRWNDWVIAFGADAQRNLFLPFGLGSLDARKLVFTMVIALGLVSLLIAPLIMRFRHGASRDPAVKLWLAFRRKLSRAGIETQASDTPLELAAGAGTQNRDVADDIDRIARIYHRIRYAPEAPDIAELARAVRDFRPPKTA